MNWYAHEWEASENILGVGAFLANVRFSDHAGEYRWIARAAFNSDAVIQGTHQDLAQAKRAASRAVKRLIKNELKRLEEKSHAK